MTSVTVMEQSALSALRWSYFVGQDGGRVKVYSVVMDRAAGIPGAGASVGAGRGGSGGDALLGGGRACRRSRAVADNGAEDDGVAGLGPAAMAI